MKGLTLRRASPTDAEAFACVMSEPEVFGGLLQLPYTDVEDRRTRLRGATAAGKPDNAAWPRGSTA